ncbi:Aldo/keto reductase [Trametes sanguinea]|nr:Aldo/keto reductase [Trametes sanguinea]
MPWDVIKLNDGTSIPSIAFGTWTLGGGAQATDYVEQAISVGFSHVDTAQAYQNEEEAGKAIRESGLAREDIYITTKFSGRDGLDIETSIRNSLKFLGVDYVDLYLIHHPRLAQPDIPTAWAQMEKLKKEGLVKSIGVSNFGVSELQTLLASANIKPAANQILFHPYVHARQLPITLMPSSFCSSSTKKERLEGYLAAGDLDLTTADVAAIDAAGALGSRRQKVRDFVNGVATGALLCAAVFGVCSYFGIDLF